MPFRSSSHRSRFVKRSRPSAAKEWGGARAAVSALTTRSPFWILDPPSALNLDNPTFLSARVAVSTRHAGVPAAGEFGAFGIIVNSGDPDLTTVPNVVPDPIDDPEADWLYRWIATWENGQAASSQFNGGADTNIITRARRKIPNGSGLLGVFSTTGLSSDWAAEVRYLVLTG